VTSCPPLVSFEPTAALNPLEIRIQITTNHAAKEYFQPQNNAQKKVEGALDFNSRCVAAVREYRECEAAKEPNLSDEKAKRKEVRDERNKIQERIEEVKKLFKEMCAAEILASEEINTTLVAQGVPKSKRPSKPRCWKVCTKPWQRLDDELKALKI